MQTNEYIVKSIELHLFFGRIMKEHALFLEAGFTPPNAAFAHKAEFFKQEFEKLLSHAVALSDGVVGKNVLCSGETVTRFTATAEQQTERFTGIAINKEITQRELQLCNNARAGHSNARMQAQVQRLNRRAIELLNGLIAFKERILNQVLNCKMFTMNYPLLLEHIIREAKLYRQYVVTLERTENLSDRTVRDTECFWNQIMMEHAQFISGLLDPTETELIQATDGFATTYAELLKTCRNAHSQTMTANTLEETVKFRDFKAAGAQGITQCEVRSVILPLLADHVLREANHYIRLLSE